MDLGTLGKVKYKLYKVYLSKYISRNKEHEKLRILAVESDEILSELKVNMMIWDKLELFKSFNYCSNNMFDPFR